MQSTLAPACAKSVEPVSVHASSFRFYLARVLLSQSVSVRLPEPYLT